MKIRMITRAAGPELSAEPGQVVDVAEIVGQALVEAGFATLVGDKSQRVEAAAVEAPERAVKPAARKRRGAGGQRSKGTEEQGDAQKRDA